MAQTVLFRGNPVELSGTPPQVGESAPPFELVGGDMSTVKLSDSDGKVRVISVIPSIDTPVCSIQTARFNKELDTLPESVVGYTVSIDTPFAQNRWCGTEGVEKMKLLSDFKGNTFGRDYGLYIQDVGVLARAVYIVDKDGNIAYSELVPSISEEPDYAAALEKLKELA